VYLEVEEEEEKKYWKSFDCLNLNLKLYANSKSR